MMDPKGKTILIVEDNELNMKLFEDLLEAHGYDTIQTSDGRDVLDIARDKKPDLIIMDIQLPEISGLEVTALLKKEDDLKHCLLYTSPSPRDRTRSRMPSSA